MPQDSAEGNDSTLIAIAMVCTLMSSLLGLLAALSVSAPWPAMALSVAFAGLAIFLATAQQDQLLAVLAFVRGCGVTQVFFNAVENPRGLKIRYKLVSGGTNDASSKSAVSSDQAEEGATGTKTAAVTRTFALRHVLASRMADDLRQILHGGPGNEAVSSADNREIIVTAPLAVMNRVQSFIIATDWPDAIERGSHYQYPRQTVMRAARSFFYACAIEDAGEAISNLLSLQVLAELKDEVRSEHFEDYQLGGVPDAEWEASLRADWPGKKELMQRLVHEWNRYPVQRIVENDGIAVGFGIKHFCWYEHQSRERHARGFPALRHRLRRAWETAVAFGA